MRIYPPVGGGSATSLSDLTAGTLIPDLILDYGSAAGTGVVVAGSNQILNASTGLVINVKSGSSLKIDVAGAIVLDVAAALLSVAPTIRFTGAGTGTAAQSEIFTPVAQGNIVLNSGLGSVIAANNGTSNIQMNQHGISYLTSVGTVTGATRSIVPTSAGIVINTPNGTSIILGVNGANGVVMSATILSVAPRLDAYLALRFAGAGTGTASQTEIYADAAAGNLILNVPTGKGVYTFVNGTSYALLVTAAAVQVPTKVRFTGAGTGTASEAEIYADGSSGNLFINVPLTKAFQVRVNNNPQFTLASMGAANVAGFSNPLTAYANSSTTTIMTVATTRSGVLECSTNNGQYCRLRVLGTGTPTIEAGSANFVVAGSATSAQFAWNVSGANLQLILGSAAACSISFLWLGTP